MGSEGDLAALRFARGCRCFAAVSAGAVCGYGWLSTTPEWIGEVELEIAPGAGEGYVWNCLTLPDHRRKGIFRSLLAGISVHARRGGLSRLWIGSLAIPAEKAVGQSGFRPALSLDSTVISGMRWLKVRPVPGANENLVEAARAVMSIGGRPLRLATTLRLSRPRRH
jgi:GNAT superfamily N-acetyltransferase